MFLCLLTCRKSSLTLVYVFFKLCKWLHGSKSVSSLTVWALNPRPLLHQSAESPWSRSRSHTKKVGRVWVAEVQVWHHQGELWLCTLFFGEARRGTHKIWVLTLCSAVRKREREKEEEEGKASGAVMHMIGGKKDDLVQIFHFSFSLWCDMMKSSSCVLLSWLIGTFHED